MLNYGVVKMPPPQALFGLLKRGSELFRTFGQYLLTTRALRSVKRRIPPRVKRMLRANVAADETGRATIITPEGLDEFIKKSDRLGGPDAAETKAYWKNLTYRAGVAVNERLDPYGEEYTQQQIAVYEEISGRSLDQEQYEFTEFNLDGRIKAPNPYGPAEPSALAVHTSRLSRAVQYSGLKRDAKVLDMGCGWGLSSELLAYLGFIVTGVDINPNFVELVNKRAQRNMLPIKAVKGAFETLSLPDNDYDAVLYYECLHHAVRPWVALARAAKHLKPSGKLILAGEPLNYMWKTWGIRNDPLSVYCIRKFGWFESGWTPEFLADCVVKCGFDVEHFADEGGELVWIMVATKRNAANASTECAQPGKNNVARRR